MQIFQKTVRPLYGRARRGMAPDAGGAAPGAAARGSPCGGTILRTKPGVGTCGGCRTLLNSYQHHSPAVQQYSMTQDPVLLPLSLCVALGHGWKLSCSQSFCGFRPQPEGRRCRSSSKPTRALDLERVARPYTLPAISPEQLHQPYPHFLSTPLEILVQPLERS